MTGSRMLVKMALLLKDIFPILYANTLRSSMLKRCKEKLLSLMRKWFLRDCSGLRPAQINDLGNLILPNGVEYVLFVLPGYLFSRSVQRAFCSFQSRS